MATRKLADMTTLELANAESRAYQRYFEIQKERQRRTFTAEYRGDNPELSVYQVDISVSVPMTIRARDEADAERIAKEVWIVDDRPTQIEYDDTVAVTIENIEFNEELTERALA